MLFNHRNNIWSKQLADLYEISITGINKCVLLQSRK